MTVIPWIREKDGANPTIVENIERFNFEGEAILIKEFESTQFDTPYRTNISYDLHVGKEYHKVGEPTKKPLSPGQKISLLPGTSAIIRVMEEVHFPRKRFGQIVSRASLLQKGIANWVTKVDPGYNGPLFVTVYNFGVEPQELSYNDPFCALYLLDTSPEGVRPYRGTSKGFEGEFKKSFYQKLSDNFKAHLPIISAITAVLFLISIIVNIINAF